MEKLRQQSKVRVVVVEVADVVVSGRVVVLAVVKLAAVAATHEERSLRNLVLTVQVISARLKHSHRDLVVDLPFAIRKLGFERKMRHRKLKRLGRSQTRLEQTLRLTLKKNRQLRKSVGGRSASSWIGWALRPTPRIF